MLKWFSSSEQNLSHYEIEKSEDGRHFVKIGSRAAWNRGSTSFYDFTDMATINAPIYYRLKIKGKDELFKYSKIILMGNTASTLMVNSVSNPIQHNITVDYMVPRDGEVLIRLFDGYGKMVSETTRKAANGSNKATLEGLEKLASGIYTINLSFENIRISKRVVKVN